MEQERALRVLEFTKIRERLSVHALTDHGQGEMPVAKAL